MFIETDPNLGACNLIYSIFDRTKNAWRSQIPVIVLNDVG